MKKEYDQRLLNWMKLHPVFIQVIKGADSFITKVTYLTFVSLVILIGYDDIKEGIAFVLAAGIPFVFFSLFRKIINARRPYEKYEFTPIISKKEKGNSFPSRHTFSIFIIATLMFGRYPYLALVFYVLGVILAIIRVIAGVHFPKDVIVGALMGIIFGIFSGQTMIFMINLSGIFG